MVRRLGAVIHGRVQGVLFRAFARRHAVKLGLTGTVANAHDGTVEVVAEGEEDVLARFLALLRRGPAFARVFRIEEGWGEPTGEFPDFRIVYRGLLDRI